MTDLPPIKQTSKDETLAHQVVITSGHSPEGQNVSCNCRRSPGHHSKAGKMNTVPMGQSKNWAGTILLYNNPENHWAKFTDEDRLHG